MNHVDVLPVITVLPYWVWWISEAIQAHKFCFCSEFTNKKLTVVKHPTVIV